MGNQISREMKRFNYLISETDAVYHEMSLKLGVSDSTMYVLYAICEYNEGYRCPLQEICRRTGVSKQTINSALRKLEAEGLVVLERRGAKNKDVCLTNEGIRLAERTAMRMIKAEDDILNSWSKEDLEKYLELTERFLTELKEKNREI